ncbi:MAG TPA: fumarylacetoacetate hydrolase family protein, partial [Conexibacter sp.]
MKLARALVDGVPRSGAIVSDDSAFAPLSPEAGSVDEIVRGGDAALAAARDAAEAAEPLPLSSVRLLAPLTRFNRDVLCCGWNYWDHFDESRGLREGQDPSTRPEHPTFFTKGPDTVIGPLDEIAYDAELSQKWDYEAEAVLIIGRDGRSIPEERAWEHVFGFCVANDVSQRDLQRAHGGQWLKGKSIDQTMPLGPWITTRDEIADPYALRITCELNGKTMQDAS